MEFLDLLAQFEAFLLKKPFLLLQFGHQLLKLELKVFHEILMDLLQRLDCLLEALFLALHFFDHLLQGVLLLNYFALLDQDGGLLLVDLFLDQHSLSGKHLKTSLVFPKQPICRGFLFFEISCEALH